MKLLLALLFVMPVFADIGPVGRSTNVNLKGELVEDSREKWFIKVKNSASATIDNGRVVILDETDDDGFSVDVTTTAGKTPICVMNETCEVGEVCSCQTYGLKTDVGFSAAQNNAVAGGPVYISEGDAGYVGAITSPAANDFPVGVFMDASSATGDVEVFIKLR